jgi:UPF0755 protein
VTVRRRVLLGALAAALVVAGLAAGGVRQARRIFVEPGPLAEARAIVVPHGRPAQLAAALHDAGAIADVSAFRAAAWWTEKQGTLHAGEFAFPAHASLAEVLTVLRTARPVQHRLTIPEGLTAAQIAAVIDRADALTGPTPPPQEGMVMPETYLYERGTPRAVVLERAERAMDQTLAAAWAGRDPALGLAGPRELLTLASLIERETARPEERGHVAAVFLNRLRGGMRLQSDASVVFAASHGGGELRRPLTRADLDAADPYNTYRNPGLPPGPIACPGAASLAAAAHPPASDDLYFVADGTGGHVFARTLDEHNRNVAKWRALGTAMR